jgi:hypothetical protein
MHISAKGMCSSHVRMYSVNVQTKRKGKMYGQNPRGGTLCRFKVVITSFAHLLCVWGCSTFRAGFEHCPAQLLSQRASEVLFPGGRAEICMCTMHIVQLGLWLGAGTSIFETLALSFGVGYSSVNVSRFCPCLDRTLY